MIYMKEKKKYIDLLFSKPKKDTGLNMPIFEFPQKNTIQQADLLFLPTGDVVKKAKKGTTYYVEEILEKKLIDQKVNYLVKWKGYSSKDNTYEPYSELKKNDAVHDMIKEFNQKNS